MTYKILCKKVDLADSSKEKILKKTEKLDKFFQGNTECRITVSEQREQMIVEIMFSYQGFLIRAEARNKELLAAVDMCMQNIERQIRKNKTKLAKRLRDSSIETLFASDTVSAEPEDEFRIIKVKHIAAKPMTVEEAILQMNMLDHDFFIFRDAESTATNVVYRRKDGNYALIETDQESI